jgi:hypothetical protein
MVDDIGVRVISLALREELQCNDTQIESPRQSGIFQARLSSRIAASRKRCYSQDLSRRSS